LRRRGFRRPAAIAAIAGIAALAACGDSPTDPRTGPDPFPPAPDDTLPYVYAVPERTGDGWETASLADVGLSESRLGRLIDLIRTGVYPRVHALLIVRDGRLVLEEYFNGLDFEAAVGDSIVGTWTAFDRDTPHNLASVTKSVTSTLVGIAIDRGLIASVDTAAYDFFPEHADLRDARKDSITLRHLLTMTSGLDWDEASHPYGDPRNDINALFSQSDPIRYILAKPAVDPPGTRWIYDGGGTNILGDVVRRTSGMSLEQFADTHLFGPLGIAQRAWVRLAPPVTYASGDLRLRPRDMAKLGQLFLDGGVWNGARIVSAEWVAEATTRMAETWNPGWGYGYQWWIYEFDVDGLRYPSFGARGWGGQLITVLPEQRLVVVQTGGNYLTGDPGDAIVRQFVLEALVR
jgi:CubicO group peptidase (beta-lactamase class C family)